MYRFGSEGRVHEINGGDAKVVCVNVVVQHVHRRVVLNDVLSGLTVAIRGALDQPQRGAEFQHPRLEGGISGLDVVKLEVGVADHVQQHKGVCSIDLVLREVFAHASAPSVYLGC